MYFTLHVGLLLSANGVGTLIFPSFIKIIIGRLGKANTLVISLLLFCVRFVIFCYLQWVTFQFIYSSQKMLMSRIKNFPSFKNIDDGSFRIFRKWQLNKYYYLNIFRNPWILLLTELVDGCCGFTAIIVGSYYCAAEAPPGMLGSLNGTLPAVIYGVGTHF